jgi:glycosyltransferase involved in cell wall biosynthesis
MRIVQVAPRGEQTWSGVLTVIVHLSAALAKRGHAVEVWQLHHWEPRTYEEQRSNLESAGVAQVPVAVDTPLWRMGRAVGTLAKSRGIDLVHLHGAFNRSNTAISRALERPFVFSPHSGYDPVSLRRSRGRKVLYRLLFERSMLDHAALVVALTQVELGQIRSFGATGSIAVIPNGVAAPPRKVDRLSFRQELQIPDGDHLAVFLGRLDVHRKGLDLLAQGIAEASRWHLALVGPRFRDVSRLETLIADLAIRERVHFVGERQGSELLQALAGADLFVLVSRWEGLPMALLEALALGTPAVVSPAVARVIDVEAAGAGWVARPGHLGTLLRDIGEGGNQQLRSRGDAARLVARRYDWDAVAEQYEAVYEQVLRSKKAVS